VYVSENNPGDFSVYAWYNKFIMHFFILWLCVEADKHFVKTT